MPAHPPVTDTPPDDALAGDPTVASDEVSVDQTKVLLREQAARTRACLAKEAAAHSRALAEQADSFIDRFTPQIVAGYWPVRSELNLLPFLSSLQDKGVRLCLPITGPAGTPLSFHAWDFGAALDRGRYNIQQPFADAEQLVPDVICVPLLAFDKTGHRLGYGGGYYDRTLAVLLAGGHRVAAVGIAYAGQEMDQLVTGQYDQPLDDVLTPEGWRRTQD